MSDIEIRNPYLPHWVYAEDRELIEELTARKITFSSLVDLCETPSLIGKAVVNLIGLAGAGNGRCLLSDTLPRMGLVIEEDYRLVGYCLSLRDSEIEVGAIIRRVDDDPVCKLVGQALLRGPKMHLSTQSRDWVRGAKGPSKPNPMPFLLKMYKSLGIDYTAKEQGLAKRIEFFADHGKYLILTPAGIGFWLGTKPEVVNENDAVEA